MFILGNVGSIRSTKGQQSEVCVRVYLTIVKSQPLCHQSVTLWRVYTLSLVKQSSLFQSSM